MPPAVLAVLLAVAAACSNAASNVIQRLTNRDEPQARTLSLRLIADLLHRPLWFGGLAAVTVSFLLQASALRFGPLALVEPLLVCELPLTFLGSAVVLHATLGRREWAAAGAMTAGLATLIIFLDPRRGMAQDAGGAVWGAGLAVGVAVVGALVVAGWRARGDARAALYGAATGIQFGVTAALMKGAVAELPQGVSAVLSAWQTYAMVASGLLALFFVQNALQSGTLVAAQPGITLLDPFVAIAWGIFAFGERASSDPVHLALAAGGGLAMACGALLLSRSPVLDTGHRARRGEERGRGRLPAAASGDRR